MSESINASVNEKETARIRARYQRLAPFHDTMEIVNERHFKSWREALRALVQGPEVLEVGVGTGKNMPYYPENVRLTAIDLTPGMAQRARRRAEELGLEVNVQLGDAQALHFEDGTFDDIVSTCVFCSVPDPLLGLEELARVARPGGRLLMLEHVRAANPLLGTLMDVANPAVVRMMGANINRRTVKNVRRSPWMVERVEDLGVGGIFKLIIARKRAPGERSNRVPLRRRQGSGGTNVPSVRGKIGTAALAACEGSHYCTFLPDATLLVTV